MINVALVFGGRSSEHEISLLSAKSILEKLDHQKYNVFPIGISKEGEWYLIDFRKCFLNESNPKDIALNLQNSKKITFIRTYNKVHMYNIPEGKEMINIDVFFPIIHGYNGEDGALQGYFELLDVPYVGANILGSALGMDKDIQKKLLREAEIPVAKSLPLFQTDLEGLNIQEIITEFTYPLFVKPVNAGSSVGVEKVFNERELLSAIHKAFEYDSKVLLEEFIKGRELECAVLGNEHPTASGVGEVIPHYEFYSYKAKYIDENGAQIVIPAQINQRAVSEIQRIAIKTYKILNCSGMARVDFFMTEDEQIYINEINTLPGFTKISMYPKLWEQAGLPYPQLLDKLIELSIERFNHDQKIKRFYS